MKKKNETSKAQLEYFKCLCALIKYYSTSILRIKKKDVFHYKSGEAVPLSVMVSMYFFPLSLYVTSRLRFSLKLFGH